MRTSLRVLLLAIAFGIGVACGDLGEALEGEECFSHDDCGPLRCVVTNPNGLNPTGLGWCLNQSACAVGTQPYCSCALDPASSLPLCQTPAESGRYVQGTVACWDDVNIATCLCLPPEVVCQYDTP
jgi:hypothetical protein